MKTKKLKLGLAYTALTTMAFAGVHSACAQQIVTNLSIPSYTAASIAVNPAQNKIYLSGGFSSAQPIIVVNGATFGQTSVGNGMGADVDVTNNNYWSGGCYSDNVTAWNSANTALSSPSTGCGCACFTSVDATHRRVWVGAQCCDSIYVFNADTYALVAGPISPNGVGGTVLANPATGRAYFTSSAGSQRVNPSTFAVTANTFSSVFSVNASANLLYATPDGMNIQIINGAPDPEVVLTNITMPFPFGGGEYMRYCVNPVLNRIYIGCSTNGTVAILNATTGQTIKTFSLGAGVTGVVTIAVDSTRNMVYAIAYQGSSVFLYVVQDSTGPSLGIAPYGNQSVLFWPASATNVVLQTTTNLTTPNWVTASNGTPFNAVAFTNSSPAQFFRLH